MNLELHTVTDAGAPEGPSSAVAARSPELGMVAVADARVNTSLMDRDLAAAASQLAIDMIRMHLIKGKDTLKAHGESPSKATQAQVQELVHTGFNIASREIHVLARRRNSTISVTVDVVLVLGRECVVAHVGDGRVYLVRKGLMHKLTQDQVEGVDGGPMEMNAPPAASRHGRHSQALGSASSAPPETLFMQLSSGDRVLATSRWLHQGLDDLRMREVITDPVADGVTARLLGSARAAGVRQDAAVGLASFGNADGDAGQTSRLATLARIPLFTYCTERELLAIAGVTRPVSYRADSTVFREGDVGQGLYLLISGQVAVIKELQQIALLGPGANFGEMSMLDEPKRSATLRAVEDTELLLITREAFFGLLKRDPTLAVKVLWNMLLRLSASLRATSDALTHSGGSVEPR